jgi:hypothetical protein
MQLPLTRNDRENREEVSLWEPRAGQGARKAREAQNRRASLRTPKNVIRQAEGKAGIKGE